MSGWWRDICDIYEGDGGEGMKTKLSRVVGNGENTNFWFDLWVGDTPLIEKFGRIIRLSEKKEAKISDMGYWGSEGWIWNLSWCRNLRAREENSVNILLSCINRYKIKQLKEDFWLWNPGKKGCFSTKEAYTHLCESHEEETDSLLKEAFKILWSNFAPKRVQAIVWKMLKMRLPTKDNLTRRTIIPTNGDILCSLCGEKNEDTYHLFFECSFVSKIWHNIYKWVGVKMIPHSDPFVNFHQHGEMFDSTSQGNLTSTLWIVMIWSIWKTRNEKIFENINPEVRKLIEEIKARLWSWQAVKNLKASSIQYSNWRIDLQF